MRYIYPLFAALPFVIVDLAEHLGGRSGRLKTLAKRNENRVLATNAPLDSARKPSERRADPEAGRVAKHPDLAL